MLRDDFPSRSKLGNESNMGSAMTARVVPILDDAETIPHISARGNKNGCAWRQGSEAEMYKDVSNTHVSVLDEKNLPDASLAQLNFQG
jgi:hypothetical protein